MRCLRDGGGVVQAMLELWVLLQCSTKPQLLHGNFITHPAHQQGKLLWLRKSHCPPGNANLLTPGKTQHPPGPPAYTKYFTVFFQLFRGAPILLTETASFSKQTLFLCSFRRPFLPISVLFWHGPFSASPHRLGGVFSEAVACNLLC